MGNRVSAEFEGQEMAQHSPSRNLTPLVFPEDDSTYSPKMTDVPSFSASCHVLSETFSLSPENIFSFKYDTLDVSSLIITCKVTPSEVFNPVRKTFELGVGLDQEFKGWPLSLISDLPGSKNKELEIKIECRNPVFHSETTLVRFNRVDESFSFSVDGQVFRFKGKDYEMKDVYGQNCAGERAECAVCLFNIKDTAIIPCHHLCVCVTCANLLRIQTNKKCPLCRVEAESLIKLTQQEV
jgi:hypothetical protein